MPFHTQQVERKLGGTKPILPRMQVEPGELHPRPVGMKVTAPAEGNGVTSHEMGEPSSHPASPLMGTYQRNKPKEPHTGTLNAATWTIAKNWN